MYGVLLGTPILDPPRLTAAQIIYTILGVPFEDLEFLTQQNSIRTNGSATAREASAAAE